MRIAREYETPMLLGLACALLALAVSAEWLWKTVGQRSVRADIVGEGGEGGGAAPSASTAPKSFALPPLERFNAIVERPLFIQGRRPVVAEGDAPAEREKPFDAQLHGIVAGPDGVLVLLKDKAGRHYKLRQNDKMDGWVLAEIGKDSVVLMRGEAKVELPLQKPKPKVAAKAEAPPAPAEVVQGGEDEAESKRGQADKRK